MKNVIIIFIITIIIFTSNIFASANIENTFKSIFSEFTILIKRPPNKINFKTALDTGEIQQLIDTKIKPLGIEGIYYLFSLLNHKIPKGSEGIKRNFTEKDIITGNAWKILYYWHDDSLIPHLIKKINKPDTEIQLKSLLSILENYCHNKSAFDTLIKNIDNYSYIFPTLTTKLKRFGIKYNRLPIYDCYEKRKEHFKSWWKKHGDDAIKKIQEKRAKFKNNQK